MLAFSLMVSSTFFTVRCFGIDIKVLNASGYLVSIGDRSITTGTRSLNRPFSFDANYNLFSIACFFLNWRFIVWHASNYIYLYGKSVSSFSFSSSLIVCRAQWFMTECSLTTYCYLTLDFVCNASPTYIRSMLVASLLTLVVDWPLRCLVSTINPGWYSLVTLAPVITLSYNFIFGSTFDSFRDPSSSGASIH